MNEKELVHQESKMTAQSWVPLTEKMENGTIQLRRSTWTDYNVERNITL